MRKTWKITTLVCFIMTLIILGVGVVFLYSDYQLYRFFKSCNFLFDFFWENLFNFFLFCYVSIFNCVYQLINTCVFKCRYCNNFTTKLFS